MILNRGPHLGAREVDLQDGGYEDLVFGDNYEVLIILSIEDGEGIFSERRPCPGYHPLLRPPLM